MVGAIVLSPTDAAGKEALVGLAQGLVVTRARAPCDAAALSRVPRRVTSRFVRVGPTEPNNLQSFETKASTVLKPLQTLQDF